MTYPNVCFPALQTCDLQAIVDGIVHALQSAWPPGIAELQAISCYLHDPHHQPDTAAGVKCTSRFLLPRLATSAGLLSCSATRAHHQLRPGRQGTGLQVPQYNRSASEHMERYSGGQPPEDRDFKVDAQTEAGPVHGHVPGTSLVSQQAARRVSSLTPACWLPPTHVLWAPNLCCLQCPDH